MKFLDRIRDFKSSSKARAEERKTRIAGDLSILISKAGLKRKDVAQRLEITEAALSIRLNGSSNLTLDSIGGICDVSGYDFDVVFRRQGDVAALSFWEKEENFSSSIDKSSSGFLSFEMDFTPRIEALHKSYVAGILHYGMPSFSPIAAANELTLNRYEAESLAA